MGIKYLKVSNTAIQKNEEFKKNVENSKTKGGEYVWGEGLEWGNFSYFLAYQTNFSNLYWRTVAISIIQNVIDDK